MSFPWANEYKPSHPFMKWMDEKLPVPRLVYNSLGAGYPVPRNLNYMWNFGFMAGFFLLLQIVTGIILAMHYAANAGVAFDSVEQHAVGGEGRCVGRGRERHEGEREGEEGRAHGPRLIPLGGGGAKRAVCGRCAWERRARARATHGVWVTGLRARRRSET